jgi:lysophospholipid acyltransferase (LPLAT)-like uncharacterized protein
MWRKIRLRLILALLRPFSFLLRIYARTIKWKNTKIIEKNPNSIFAILHGQALIMILYGRDKGIYTLTSFSEDGLIAGRLQELMGFRVIYGSSELGRSSRGARSGTMRLLKAIKFGGSTGITVDGPLGPAFRVHKGVLYLSQKTGRPIVPVVASVSRALVLKSWDRFMIPYPFSEVRMLDGEPLRVGPEDDLEEKAIMLEEALRRLYSEAMGPFSQELQQFAVQGQRESSRESPT